MKAILEFNLPEENYHYHNAIFADEMHDILFNLSNRYRSILKYEEHSGDVKDIVEMLQRELIDDMAILPEEY